MILRPNGNGFAAGIFFKIWLGIDFEDMNIKSRAYGAELKVLELAAWNTLTH